MDEKTKQYLMGRPVLDVICGETVFREETIKYVPNMSNMVFSLSPNGICSERDYIGEDEDAHPEFFCFGEPGEEFPDPGTFHCFTPDCVLKVEDGVLLISDIDTEIR